MVLKHITPPDDNYCGPASVQMALQYISGQTISQASLATELKTALPTQGGTPLRMMRIPFINRGYDLVGIDRSNLDTLKELNSKGYVLIIAMSFDASSMQPRDTSDTSQGHYVVVVGYDQAGIYVNDPWPSNWSEPLARKSGPNAFISNTLFAILWSRYDRWMIRIPYPAHASTSVTSVPTIILPLIILTKPMEYPMSAIFKPL